MDGWGISCGGAKEAQSIRAVVSSTLASAIGAKLSANWSALVPVSVCLAAEIVFWDTCASSPFDSLSCIGMEERKSPRHDAEIAALP